ncbi:MAG: hypothetical protein ACE5R6_10235 [Candidatus Heimdallarchaeota archaeon]
MAMKAYHVTDAGETIEIELHESRLENLDAVLILDEQRRDLWVLRGPLDVRKKFLVARTAANLNLTEGLRYRIRHVEPNERQNVIRALLADEEPKLASIAEFPQEEERVLTPSVPSALKPLTTIVELAPAQEEKRHLPPKEKPDLVPTAISTFFESFTRLALFERTIPKDELPPRAELERSLQQYLKTFIDALYT